MTAFVKKIKGSDLPADWQQAINAREDRFYIVHIDETAEGSEASGWQAAWKDACGMWKDRNDIDEILAENRARLNERIDRLHK